MSASDLDLLDNHLAFLVRHRGATIHRDEHGIIASGDAPGLPFWLPLTADAALPAVAATVRVFPFSGAGWDERLQADGFRLQQTLSYRVRSGLSPPRSPPGAMRIRQACGSADALAFAAVQLDGFLDPDDSLRERWRTIFDEAAMGNVGAADQEFWIADVDSAPAAVLLVLKSARVLGIYAVATRPAFRRRGLSTALLHHVQTRHDRVALLTLQVVAGSVAEGMYAACGFAEVFPSSIWAR